jgi:hypothetical protein
VTALQERDEAVLESPWNRLDRLFDEWMRTQPMRRLLGGEAPGEEIIRVDEYRDDDIHATYKDGVPEIRVPIAPPSTPEEPKKTPVEHG